MRERVRDKSRLEHILESIDNIFEFTKEVTYNDLITNKLLNFAVVKNLEIIGEASYRITKEFRANHPEIEWRVIIDLRHVLVHGYYKIKQEIIWDIIQKDLLPLREKIQILYDNEP